MQWRRMAAGDRGWLVLMWMVCVGGVMRMQLLRGVLIVVLLLLLLLGVDPILHACWCESTARVVAGRGELRGTCAGIPQRWVESVRMVRVQLGMSGWMVLDGCTGMR